MWCTCGRIVTATPGGPRCPPSRRSHARGQRRPQGPGGLALHRPRGAHGRDRRAGRRPPREAGPSRQRHRLRRRRGRDPPHPGAAHLRRRPAGRAAGGHRAVRVLQRDQKLSQRTAGPPRGLPGRGAAVYTLRDYVPQGLTVPVQEIAPTIDPFCCRSRASTRGRTRGALSTSTEPSRRRSRPCSSLWWAPWRSGLAHPLQPRQRGLGGDQRLPEPRRRDRAEVHARRLWPDRH